VEDPYVLQVQTEDGWRCDTECYSLIILLDIAQEVANTQECMVRIVEPENGNVVHEYIGQRSDAIFDYEALPESASVDWSRDGF
jgi:hypothetical protein